jgi:hypothetical protein
VRENQGAERKRRGEEAAWPLLLLDLSARAAPPVPPPPAPRAAALRKSAARALLLGAFQALTAGFWRAERGKRPANRAAPPRHARARGRVASCARPRGERRLLLLLNAGRAPLTPAASPRPSGGAGTQGGACRGGPERSFLPHAPRTKKKKKTPQTRRSRQPLTPLALRPPASSQPKKPTAPAPTRSGAACPSARRR